MKQEYPSKTSMQTDDIASAGVSTSVLVLISLLAVGFIVRIVLAHRNVYPSYDGTFYLNTARDLVALGKYYRSGFPLGYPLLIAPVLLNMDWSLPQAPLIAGQIVNVIAGTLLGLLSYRFARGSFPRAVSVSLAGIVLFLPLSLQLSASDLSDPSFTCFLLGGWMLFSSNRMGLAGLVWGYGTLIRPEGMLVIALVAGWSLLHKRWEAWRLVAVAGMLIGPYIIFMSTQSGDIVVSGKWTFLEHALQSYSGVSLLTHYLSNVRTLLSLLNHTIGPVLLLLAVVGIIGRPRLWLFCLSPLALLPIFDFRMAERYLLPYLPFILAASAHGCFWMIGRWTAFSVRRALSSLIAVLVIVTVLLTGYSRRDLLRGNFEYYPAMRNAGIWMRERVGRDTMIAGRKPYVSYWAWCKFKRIPDMSQLTKLVAWAEDEGCDYLVVHIGVALGMAPVLVPLIEGPPADLRERIRLVRAFAIPGQPNETTYIYEIVGR